MQGVTEEGTQEDALAKLNGNAKGNANGAVTEEKVIDGVVGEEKPINGVANEVANGNVNGHVVA